MSLVSEYQRQFAWRDWQTALSLCPIERGDKVLDLGCGPGTLSLELSKRGATVVGIDGNEQLLEVARKICPANCTFLNQDLRSIEVEEKSFDGIWCSFTAAYFTDFESALQKWLPKLKPNGWICITEMDDLFGHEPMPTMLRKQLDRFYEESFLAGSYDFRSGSRISAILRKAGFEVKETILADRELSFEGAGSPEVIEAWSLRLDRMGGLQRFLGSEFNAFKSAFLAVLGDPNHRSNCRVICTLGARG